MTSSVMVSSWFIFAEHPGVEQRETEAGAVLREQAIALADDNRRPDEIDLIHQLVLERPLGELRAADQQQVPLATGEAPTHLLATTAVRLRQHEDTKLGKS
jgi:hypothetical protein